MKILPAPTQHASSRQFETRQVPSPETEATSDSVQLGSQVQDFRRKNPSLIRIGTTAVGATAGGVAGHFLGGPTGSAIGATVGAIVCNELSRGSVDRNSRLHASEMDHRLFPVAERLNTIVAVSGAIGIVAAAALITLG